MDTAITINHHIVELSTTKAKIPKFQQARPPQAKLYEESPVSVLSPSSPLSSNTSNNLDSPHPHSSSSAFLSVTKIPRRNKQVYRSIIHDNLSPLDLSLLQDVTQEGLLVSSEIEELLDRLTCANEFHGPHGTTLSMSFFCCSGETLKDLAQQVFRIFSDAYQVVEIGCDNILEALIRSRGDGELDDLDFKMYNFFDCWYESLMFIVLVLWILGIAAFRLGLIQITSPLTLGIFIFLPFLWLLLNHLTTTYGPQCRDAFENLWWPIFHQDKLSLVKAQEKADNMNPTELV